MGMRRFGSVCHFLEASLLLDVLVPSLCFCRPVFPPFSCIFYITQLSGPLDSRQVWPQRSLWKPQRSSEGVQRFFSAGFLSDGLPGAGWARPSTQCHCPSWRLFLSSPLLRLRVSTPQLLHVADVFSTVPAHPPFEGNRPLAACLLLTGTRPDPCEALP